MLHAASAAFRTQVSTLLSSRASRWLLVLFGLLLGVLAMSLPAGLLTRGSLNSVATWLLLPGVPLAALVMAELPIRDGLAQRTLLYPLLGPASRVTLVLVRTLVVSMVVMLAIGLVMIVLRLVAGSAAELGGELPALVLASVCYVGLFGLMHLLTRRGLILGLALIVLADMPLRGVPFAIRVVVPATHVEAIARLKAVDPLVQGMTPTTTSPAVSATVLVVLAVVATAATAFRFSRMNLQELC